MPQRARIFVDYWNFQLNWNERASDARCNWRALPAALLRGAERATPLEGLTFEGAHIYAAVEANNENLLNWLESFLERQPGFIVSPVRLVRRQRGVRCSACGAEHDACPSCGEHYTVTASKGLAGRIVCDLMALHHEGAYEVPVVVSSDNELLPAVHYLVQRGVKVLHAGWRDGGGELGRAAWASVELDPLIPELVRS